MDYVDNNGADTYDSDGTPCPTGLGGGGYFTGCVHAGEKLTVQLPAIATSCDGLTITDDLGVFDWECKVVSSVATFFTRGLKSDKGLKDLIDN